MPDPADLAVLVDTARTGYRCPTTARVLAVPGTDALIHLIPRLIPSPQRVAIVTPTYTSHALAWTAAGHEVIEVTDPNDIGACRFAVVVNPNNPDGRRWSPEALRLIADRLRDTNGFLLVDEAFADVDPSVSVIQPHAHLSNIVALRSFGKFFGLAGLRLGFCMTAHPIGAKIAATLGDWPVSGAALMIGRRALADTTWIEANRERLAQAQSQLDAVLTARRCTVIGGTSLFRLVRVADAKRVFDHLASRGILVRPFPGRDVLRFGLPASDAACARLDDALRD